MKPAILYTKPYIYKGNEKSTDWYVVFHFWNEEDGKMKRVRKSNKFNYAKYSPTLKDKRENFKQLLEVITEDLESGWNPFQEGSGIEVLAKNKVLTLQEGYDLYLEGKKGLKLRSLQTFSRCINKLIKELGGDRAVNTITTQTLVDLLHHLESQTEHGWRNSNWNNQKLNWSNFFSFLKDKKHITVNPASEIKMRKKQIAVTHEVYTDEDMKSIIQWLQKHYPKTAIYCQTVYFTCIRPAELRKLQVKHLDMKKKKIFIPGAIAKNGHDGYVGIDDELYDIFNSVLIDYNKPDDYIFSSALKSFSGERPITNYLVSKGFLKCLKELGLDGKEYTVYSFKHTSNVKKYLSGWSISDICAANRHKSLVETEIYLRSLLKQPAIVKKVPAMF
jgi:integrase